MRHFILLTVCCFATTEVQAHDLEENRANLVLRNQTHLSVTLYVNYAKALHRALLPNREYGAFLFIYSSMRPDDLKKELQRAQSKFEADIRILPKGASEGKAMRLTEWTWPDIKQVQATLQHQVMQVMVDGHVHEPPIEIHADAVSLQKVVAVTIRFPAEFEKVLVVSYSPNQVWVDPKTVSPEIRF